MKLIVLIGNCQVQALYHLYRRFVGRSVEERLVWVKSYEAISPADAEAIAAADIIAEHTQDFAPKANIAGIETKARRIRIPIVNAGFLWPFAGQPHPKNKPSPYLEGGPYGAEASDGYLNKLINKGVEPEEALRLYEALDINKTVNLDRLLELGLEKQAKRDGLSDFRIAPLIESHFRKEQIFLTPYHPNARIAVALASQLFEQLEVDAADIQRMQLALRLTPFPNGELPVHPAVARHFGLAWASPEKRYRFLHEGWFNFPEYVLRYMTYTWNERLEHGLTLVRAQEFETARPTLETALVESPYSAAGHSALAKCMEQMGNRSDAVVLVCRAIQLEPEHAGHRAQCGILLQQVGEHQGAEHQLRLGAALEPFDSHFPGLLANFLARNDRAEEAIAVARHGLACNPYAENLLVELGYNLSSTGNKGGAETAFREALVRAPNSARAAGALARLLNPAPTEETLIGVERLVEEGRLDEALALIGQTDRGSPRALTAAVALARALSRAKRNDDANALAKALVAEAPQSLFAVECLGDVLAQSGDLPGAIEAFKRSLEIKDERAHPYAALGHFFSALGRHEEAIAARRKAVAIEPSNPYRRAQLAHVLMNSGALDLAETAIREAIALDSSNAAFHGDLSLICARARRPEQAIDAARRALEIDPSQAPLWRRLGDEYVQVRNYPAAQEAYRRSLALEPSNAHTLRHLSLTYAKLGEGDNAWVAAEDALRLDAKNIGFLQELQRLAPQSERMERQEHAM